MTKIALLLILSMVDLFSDSELKDGNYLWFRVDQVYLTVHKAFNHFWSYDD